MASSFGGSDSGGGRRRFREQMPARKTGQQVEIKRARVSAGSSPSGDPQFARVSAGSSPSGVNSSEENGVPASFRSMLKTHVMRILEYYVEQELLTETTSNVIGQEVVAKITTTSYHDISTLETEKSMRKYLSANEKHIKDCLKGCVEKSWLEVPESTT